MSRYSRDDPRSIFFSGSTAGTSPIRSYAGSELLRRTSAAPSQSASASGPPEPSSSTGDPATTSTGAAKPAPHSPVVRIIPILYPAQPARLIGSPSSYGASARPTSPAEGDEPAAVRQPPEPPTSATPPPATSTGGGILKSPHGLGAPSGGAPSTPSRVSFSTPRTPAKPAQRPNGAEMAGTSAGPPSVSACAPPSAPTTNGMHGRAPDATPKQTSDANSPLPGVSHGAGGAAGGGAGGESCRVQLALYGWRKKCLYALIFVLMVMIIVNLALTLWIMKVMEFSSNGMGQLKIVPGGIQLTGQALVLNTLRASAIRSKHGQPISIESSRNLSVNTRNAYGAVENQLFLGHDRLEVLANHFRITDTHGTNLFAVDRDEVIVGAGSLRVEGEGGVTFRDSIQTPLVRADAGKDLKLESPTRSLEARATQEIFIQSRAGGIETTCLNDLKLHSVAGTIRLDSSAIYMPNLKTVQALPGSSGSSFLSGSSSARGEPAGAKIYQLCACSSGKLFLAAPNSICAADDTAICR